MDFLAPVKEITRHRPVDKVRTTGQHTRLSDLKWRKSGQIVLSSICKHSLAVPLLLLKHFLYYKWILLIFSNIFINFVNVYFALYCTAAYAISS